MNSDQWGKIEQFISNELDRFHSKRLESLDKLQLVSLLKRKNPYLFRAKNINIGGELVKALVDAHLSSHEETIFGNSLEHIVIFIAQLLYGGQKSTAEGIDLDFILKAKRYLVSIKSGPNWGNSSQISKMRQNFKTAKQRIKQGNVSTEIICVNGCCYGISKNEDQGDYQKLCGQAFWQFLTGEEYFHQKLIEPFGKEAKVKNDNFHEAYAKKLNQFTKAFIQDYCHEDGMINWNQWLSLNSGHKLN